MSIKFSMMLNWPQKTTFARNTCTQFVTLPTVDFFMIYLKQFHVRIMFLVDFVPKEISVTISIKQPMIHSSQNLAQFYVSSLKQQDIAQRVTSVCINTLKLYVKILVMDFA